MRAGVEEEEGVERGDVSDGAKAELVAPGLHRQARLADLLARRTTPPTAKGSPPPGPPADGGAAALNRRMRPTPKHPMGAAVRVNI